MNDKVLTREENGVQWLILNQPEKRNAISLEMYGTASKILNNFEANNKMRVLVITGAEDTAFCAGADISEFEEHRNNAEKAKEYGRISSGFFSQLYELEKPTIAMIHGYCMGGGVALAASCDIRLCSDDAVFAVPAARLGIGYEVSYVERIMNLVGPSFVKEIIYSAKRYSAEEAVNMGFVNRSIDKAELERHVVDFASGIAINAPLSIRAAKIVVSELLKSEEDRRKDRCTSIIEKCLDSEDYANARKAFMEKRKPVFVGN